MGVFDKAGIVDIICILVKDVDPTVEKLYRSDLLSSGLLTYRSSGNCCTFSSTLFLFLQENVLFYFRHIHFQYNVVNGRLIINAHIVYYKV